jgi:hypothetical protein
VPVGEIGVGVEGAGVDSLKHDSRASLDAVRESPVHESSRYRSANELRWIKRHLPHPGEATAVPARLPSHPGNLKAVQKLLGHSSITTTGDIYTDWDIDQLEETMRYVVGEDTADGDL